MKRIHWIFIIVLNVIVLFLGITPFLPGPESLEFLNGIYFLFQLLAIFGIFVTLAGIITIYSAYSKKKITQSKKFQSILLITLPLALIISVSRISNSARDFSRNYAIAQTDDLINAVEEYKLQHTVYPDSVTQLIPKYIEKVPSDKVIGIKGFHYLKDSTGYKIMFTQNVLLGWNFEVVQYSPNGNHKGEGEFYKLYETKHPKWKYYIFD